MQFPITQLLFRILLLAAYSLGTTVSCFAQEEHHDHNHSTHSDTHKDHDKRHPDEAKKGGAFIIATGRSDYPNQVNNVLAFPGIFRGVLDSRSKPLPLSLIKTSTLFFTFLIYCHIE